MKTMRNALMSLITLGLVNFSAQAVITRGGKVTPTSKAVVLRSRVVDLEASPVAASSSQSVSPRVSAPKVPAPAPKVESPASSSAMVLRDGKVVSQPTIEEPCEEVVPAAPATEIDAAVGFISETKAKFLSKMSKSQRAHYQALKPAQQEELLMKLVLAAGQACEIAQLQLAYRQVQKASTGKKGILRRAGGAVARGVRRVYSDSMDVTHKVLQVIAENPKTVIVCGTLVVLGVTGAVVAVYALNKLPEITEALRVAQPTLDKALDVADHSVTVAGHTVQVVGNAVDGAKVLVVDGLVPVAQSVAPHVGDLAGATVNLANVAVKHADKLADSAQVVLESVARNGDTILTSVANNADALVSTAVNSVNTVVTAAAHGSAEVIGSTGNALASAVGAAGDAAVETLGVATETAKLAQAGLQAGQEAAKTTGGWFAMLNPFNWSWGAAQDVPALAA